MDRDRLVDGFVVGIASEGLDQNFLGVFGSAAGVIDPGNPERRSGAARSGFPCALQGGQGAVFLIEDVPEMRLDLNDVGIVRKLLLRAGEEILGIPDLVGKKEGIMLLGGLGKGAA
jgi:hypothetical protein